MATKSANRSNRTKYHKKLVHIFITKSTNFGLFTFMTYQQIVILQADYQ